MQHILGERKSAMYHTMIVDSSPYSSHVEQTTFLLRYLVRHESRLKIVERFQNCVECCHKTGSKIAQMIPEALESHAIPLVDCRA